MKIFVDADDDVRLSRRILKRQNDSLEDIEKMLKKYQTQVKPAYEKYVEPGKKFADIVIPNYGFNVLTDEKGNCVIDEDQCNMPVISLIAEQLLDRF